MKIAFLLLAHNTPKHLRRLVAALSSSSAAFFIHIDQKSYIDPFIAMEGGNVHFTRERVPVFWGDFSQVDATLILLRAALTSKDHFDRFVLLSGSDYPLRSARAIENFFESNSTKEFMNLVEMPCEAAGKSISRLNTYKLSPRDGAVTNLVRKALMRTGLAPRHRDYKTYLGDLTPFAGSQWWALSRDAVELVLEFTQTNSEVVQFFRNTQCPDESFFQTVVGNSKFRSRLAHNLTYADWSGGRSSPAFITEKYLAFFQSTSSFNDVYGAGEMLFARKFSDDAGDLIARLESQKVAMEGALARRH